MNSPTVRRRNRRASRTMRDSWVPVFAIPSPHDPRRRGPRLRPPDNPIHSTEILMKEKEQKDDSKDDNPEIPDVSGGFAPDDVCFPIPPVDDYPPYPHLHVRPTCIPG